MKPTIRKVIVEAQDGYFLAMDEDGGITEHRTAKAVVRSIRAKDATDPDGFLVTVIEWRGVPDNFQIPDA